MRSGSCRAAAGSALLATVIAACAGSPPATPNASASQSPAGGRRFTSADFSAAIPPGWADETTNRQAVTAVHVSGTLVMLLIAPASFTDRVNEHIDVSIAPQPVPSDQLGAYLQSVAQSGATGVSPVESFNVDGTSGLFVTYDLAAGTSTNMAQDMVVNHGDNTYDIVLNTSTADFDQQLAALQQVIDTWSWRS